MAWTTPSSHIWATAEVLTASNMNTYIEANLQYLGQGYGAWMYSGAVQSIPASTPTVVNFDTDANDPNGMTTTGSGAKITIPTGAAGVYICTWSVGFVAGADGDTFNAALNRNGATQAEGEYTAQGAAAQCMRTGAIVLPLAVADFVQVAAFHNHSAALNTLAGEQYTWFAIHLVGPV